jgi:nucleotide-binding universal stress UspA family protein
MKKIKRILIPIDFSEHSMNAFRYGLKLADKIGASIDLINIIFPEGESIDYPVLVAQATQTKIETTRKRIKKFVNQGLVTGGEGLDNVPMVEADIEIGTPINGICNFAHRESIDLIIMGSKGDNRSNLEKWMGSVAKGVVGKALCPVLVIPENTEFSDFKTMTYATDIRDADPFEIWKTLQMIKPYHPAVNVVHVNLKKEGNLKSWEKLESIKAFFEEQQNMKVNIFHIPGKDTREELKSFVEQHDTDLLVMYQTHHGFWDRLFFKSNTQEMANYTSVPLLIQKTEK